jgi:hypothetical protein
MEKSSSENRMTGGNAETAGRFKPTMFWRRQHDRQDGCPAVNLHIFPLARRQKSAL